MCFFVRTEYPHETNILPRNTLMPKILCDDESGGPEGAGRRFTTEKAVISESAFVRVVASDERAPASAVRLGAQLLVAAQTRGYLPRKAACLHGCKRRSAALTAMNQRM